jgi:hypothetical protein
MGSRGDQLAGRQKVLWLLTSCPRLVVALTTALAVAGLMCPATLRSSSPVASRRFGNPSHSSLFVGASTPPQVQVQHLPTSDVSALETAPAPAFRSAAPADPPRGWAKANLVEIPRSA